MAANSMQNTFDRKLTERTHSCIHLAIQKKEDEATAPHIIGFRVVGGPVKGKEFNKKWGRRITVGRTARSHLHVKDPEVSEKHAEIQWNGKSWMFKDVGSSNGTEINGVTLKEGGMLCGRCWACLNWVWDLQTDHAKFRTARSAGR